MTDQIEERLIRDARVFNAETAGFDAETFVADLFRRLLPSQPTPKRREQNLRDYAALANRYDTDPAERRRIADLTAEFDDADAVIWVCRRSPRPVSTRPGVE